MSRSTYSSDSEELDVRVRRYQRAPSPHYVQTVREERPPRGYYQTGPVYLAPERSSGTMVTTHTHRSRSRDRRSSPPQQQQMAPVVIENKIINEHSSDDDSDHHRRRRHRDRSVSSSSAYRDELALERVRREFDEMRLRDDERERAAQRAMRSARDNNELIRAKAELDEIKRERERRETEKRVKDEMERKHLEEEKRREDEKKRREREAEDAVEKYKLKLAKEREDKEKADKEYKDRMRADLLAAGVDDKEVEAILEKKKVKKEEKEKDRPTYTRMSLRHLDIETLVYYKIEFEYDQEPGFILIKRWVPEWEQDMLWAHTRKIRVVETKKHKHEEKLILEIEDKKKHHHHDKLGDDQFEWVRKKERRRSKSPGLLMYLAGAKPA